MADRRILILALVLGAVAAGLAVAFLSNADQPAALPDSVKTVVVAKSEIPVGTKITQEMVETKPVDATAAIPDAAADPSAVVGLTARYPIAAGEQVSATRLVATAQVQALSFQIPPGLRAYSMPVGTRLAGFIAPGDFVDILIATTLDQVVNPSTVANQPSLVFARATPAAGTGAPAPVPAVTTVLQNIQVLTVSAQYVRDGLVYDATTRGTPPDAEEGGGVSYVTLALTPEQAQLLWLAGQNGEMTLTLRPFGENKVQPVGTVEPITTVR
jgi:pilus assembly protein CpaB